MTFLAGVQVLQGIESLDKARWAALEGGRFFYQSYEWLSWVASATAGDDFYCIVVDSSSRWVGGMACYVVQDFDDSWTAWYDPIAVFMEGDPEAERRKQAWRPTVLLGSRAGYTSDVVTASDLGQSERREVAALLLAEGRKLAGSRACALMYSPEQTCTLACLSSSGGSKPFPVSANTRIDVIKGAEYESRFTRRRRGNIRRERDAFLRNKSTVSEHRLSECVDDVVPLLGNVHRRHGADETDVDVWHYLESQAGVLDDASKVFVERVDGRAAGFSLCYQWGRQLHVRVVGFDYSAAAPYSYFNLAFYLPVAYAERAGLDSVHLGVGTYEAKIARGAVLEPLWSVVWAPTVDDARWLEAGMKPGEDARQAAALGWQFWV